MHVLAQLHPWEEYQIAHSHVGMGPSDADGFETDLFGGLTEPTRS